MTKSTRRALVLTLALGATLPAGVGAQDTSFRTDTLAPGVFALIRPVSPDLVAISNHLVVLDDDGVTLVDAGLTPSVARGVLAEIRRLTDLPLRWIVNTHWHDDHVWGNQVFREAFPDVRIVAHPYTRDWMRDSLEVVLERNRPEYASALERIEAALRTGRTSRGDTVTAEMRASFESSAAAIGFFLPEMEGMRMVVPDVVVDDAFVIHRPGRRIHVRHLGRGNTPGDLVVHLPDEGIVASGDLVVSPVPYSFGSFLGEWTITLDRLKALGADVIVPGHGEPMRDVAYVERVQGLIAHTLEQVGSAATRGLDLDAVREAVDWGPWRERFTDGDPVLLRGFASYWEAPAVERAYLERTGALPSAPSPGDPDGSHGTVLDAAGAPVPGALVTARLAMGRAVTVYADAAGEYRLPADARAAARTLEGRSPAGEDRPLSVEVPGGVGVVDLVLAPAPADDEPAAARFLAEIPQGPERSRLVVDCGGCHTFNSIHARRGGRARTEAEWRQAMERMVAAFGPGSGFPIVSAAADPVADAAWLAATLTRDGVPASVPPPAETTARAGDAVLTEYDLPVPGDLPHDLVVDADGRVVITGMFTHRMYVLDPATAVFDTVGIPVPGANPRAVDIDRDGRWWVLLGGPGKAAVHDPTAGTWESFDLGTYPHSLAFDDGGGVWFNGHFSVAPEIVGVLDPGTGAVRRFEVPPHAPRWETESTVPYGLRVAPDGTVWGTQLRGNGLLRLDPATGDVRRWEMPTPESGPRRPDVAADGAVWIPEFGADRIARFDPGTGTFTEWDFPVDGAAPYVIRVDRVRGTIWIGTGHADVVAAFDPVEEAFTVFTLPTRGALVRHLDVDERTGDVWVAYGASPGRPAKILRISRP